MLDIVQHFGRRWRQNGCGGWPPARSLLHLGILNRDNMAPSGWSARRSALGFLLASSELYPQGCELDRSDEVVIALVTHDGPASAIHAALGILAASDHVVGTPMHMPILSL